MSEQLEEGDAELMAASVLTNATPPDPRVGIAFKVASEITDPTRIAPAVMHAIIMRCDEILLMRAVVTEAEGQDLEATREAHQPIIDRLDRRVGETRVLWAERIGGDSDLLGSLAEALVAGLVLGADLHMCVEDAVDIKTAKMFVDLEPGEELTEEKLRRAADEAIERAESERDDVAPEDDRGFKKEESDG